MSAVLFFGCWSKTEPGHCFHEPGRALWRPDAPWTVAAIDSYLAPDDPHQREGRARFHVRSGWACLAFWDRSADHRPGSNSAFLAKGATTPEQVIAAAEREFPTIVARLAKWPPEVVP